MSGEDHVTRVHRALGAPRRAEILRLLQGADGPLGIQDVVDATALHPNTVRNHLDRLVQAGLVEQFPEDRTAPGRPRTLYVAAAVDAAAVDAAIGTGSSAAAIDENGYRDLTGILEASLREVGNPTALAVMAGQHWINVLGTHDWPARPASAPTAIADLVVLLDEMGLAPRMVEDASAVEITLPASPNIAAEDLLVLLNVHVGMVRRALDRLDSPVEVASIDASEATDPSIFVIRLHARADRHDSGHVPLPVVSQASPMPVLESAQRRPA